ncbi:MAG: 2-C-methyl-D-erythritol 2,4-cyclodiphosphate synthase [Candidatus Eisenbacteria bacterium]
MESSPSFRVGFGYDIHRLVPGRPLLLAGIEIPFEKGLLGHSDGDAVSHAICDAALGAVGFGDIGTQFSDRDPKWKGVSGSELLERTVALIAERGARFHQVDVTVVAEAPRLAPHRESMVAKLRELTRTDLVSVKARTNEGLGPVGEGQAIQVYAVVLLELAGG